MLFYNGGVQKYFSALTLTLTPQKVTSRQTILVSLILIGITVSTPKYSKINSLFTNYNKKTRKATAQAVVNRALNEPWEWYDKCARRERNKGKQ